MVAGKMKIVKFLGGLGNQMFQYAFYRSLQQQFKVKADLSGFKDYSLHHGFELTKVFGIPVVQASAFELRLYQAEARDWLTRKLRRLYGTKGAAYNEPEEFGYDPTIYQDASPRYFWGYWQHYRYIQQVEEQLREAFRFREPLTGSNAVFLDRLQHQPSVAVHVRRGDYLDHPVLGGICDLDYYLKAIQLMKDRLGNPLLVFFSNDSAWCRQYLWEENAVYVDWNKNSDSYKDMQLMSHCHHYIIANSSFSWWGQWLNRNPDKIVISPSRWVNTDADPAALILPHWIQL